ncbi:MAG: 50S ribosomal protein L32 [Clostridia bacterium]|nr:50S ribosomal protein L32 [Clostridia bacterium]MDR3643907.1 50S ribosomal protein L32 [Clostridia bacterium]
MAVPKRKISRQRRDKRRSSVWKLETPNLIVCPQCKELTLPHRVCGSCGFYKGREVIKKEDVKKEA